jgi:hypothetical protein
MTRIQEGCSIDYRDDCAVVTVVFRLEYYQEHPEVHETHPEQILSPGARSLRDEVERYLCRSLGPGISHSGRLLKPRLYEIRCDDLSPTKRLDAHVFPPLWSCSALALPPAQEALRLLLKAARFRQAVDRSDAYRRCPLAICPHVLDH